MIMVRKANIDSAMEDSIASTPQSTKNNGLEKRLKKKNEKRRGPPFPDLCSAYIKKYARYLAEMELLQRAARSSHRIREAME